MCIVKISHFLTDYSCFSTKNDKISYTTLKRQPLIGSEERRGGTVNQYFIRKEWFPRINQFTAEDHFVQHINITIIYIKTTLN